VSFLAEDEYASLYIGQSQGGNRAEVFSRTDAHAAHVTMGRCAPGHTKGHVLFVSRQRIIGKTNGSSAYLLDLATAARSAGFTPHLLQPTPDIMGRWPFMRLRPETAVFETHVIRKVVRYRNWVISRDLTVLVDAMRAVASRLVRRIGLTGSWFADRPRPYSIAAAWKGEDRSYLQCATGHADIVIADYAFQAEAFDHFPRRPSAIVMHDLFHRRDAEPGVTDSVAKLCREDELALLSKADAVIAIQSSEARFIQDNIPGTLAILAPMATQPLGVAQPGRNGRILFVGSNTAPNIVGLEWFLRDVWPTVRAGCPFARLDVAGTVNAGFVGQPQPGVTFHGMVGDLTALYADAAIVISPLTFGSGLKIKLVEAMANGKAIVATRTTLEGVEDECSGAVICADDEKQFGDAVVALLTDEQRRIDLANAALCAAHAHFSSQVCHAGFIAWLESNKPSREFGGIKAE